MDSPIDKAKGMFGLYRNLPAAIYVLFVATIINGIGSFVFPFLVLLLTQRLGFSDGTAGAFMSLATLAYMPGSFIGGKLADRMGRKRIMIFGQVMASVMFAVAGFLGDSHLVPWFILLHLLFDGITDPARSALQTDVTTQENRQASFSLTYLGHNMGFAIGPVIAGYLFYSSPQWLFFGNAIAGLLSVAFVIWRVPESKPDAKTIEASYGSDSTERAQRGSLLKALLSRPRLLLLAVCITCFSFTYSQALFALPLHTTGMFGKSGALIYGTMMSVNAIVVVLCNAPIVMLLRKRPPLRNIALAGILYAIGFASMGLARLPLWLYALTVVYTLGEITDATNTHYYIANNTPMSHRARFSAIMPVITGFGHAIAPAIGGRISEQYGLDLLWIIIGVTALMGSFGVKILYWTEKKNKLSQ